MDMAIINEELGKSEDELIARVRKAQPRLYPTTIVRDGSIMEWDFEDPEVHHRHFAHLSGPFLGHTISSERTPNLCKAAEFSLYKRGEDGPGWSTAWKATLCPRLGDSDNVYRMVKHLFKLVDPDHEIDFEWGFYDNKFTAHPPFQIDANFGFSAAMAQMLVQSTIKDLQLFPALPRNKWGNGCIQGLKAREGVTASVCWRDGNLDEVGLWSKDHSIIKRIHYRGVT